ncbi:MAG: YwpF-like family protein [Bacillaceae bacterium]|nr:YwpF-like family protein [Bacillaceae bacterium]
MKTFKLISLDVLQKQGEELHTLMIDLVDGLIINREDEQNRWLIEAYTDQEYLQLFRKAKKEDRELVLQVKISKETNQPATFLVKVVAINEIGDYMNVLFLGTIVNKKQEQIENVLQELIEQGYQGEMLLKKFKKRFSQSI